VGRDPPAPDTVRGNTLLCVGCGGTAPSPSLGLLAVATAMASSPRDPCFARVPSRAVAPQRGPLYFYHGLLLLAQPLLDHQPRKPSDGSYTQLRHDPLAVSLYRARADAELLTDLPVGAAIGDP